MKAVRMVLGGAALLLLLVAFNILIWERSPIWLYATVGMAIVCGLGWVAAAIGEGGRTAMQGRTVGAAGAVLGAALFLGICIVLYAFAKRPDAAWDLSEEGRQTLAPQTVQVLENMAREVEVLCFFIDMDDALVQISKSKTRRFLNDCQKHTDLLTVKEMDQHIDQASLMEMGITHLSPQGTVVVRSGARKKIIWFSGGSPRLEERDFTNALVNVLRDAEPKLYFLTGHGERRVDDDDPVQGGSMLRQFLEGESYRIEPFAVKMSDPAIPEDCDLLVIGGLTSELYDEELAAIDAYLARGGRLLLLAEPWALARLPSRGERLRAWLKDGWGIEMGLDIVVAVSEQRTVTEQRQNVVRVQLSADMGPFAEVKDETPGEYRGCYNAQHPLTRSFDQLMALYGAGTVRKSVTAPSGVATVELLRTPPGYWAEEDLELFTETGKPEKSGNERGGPLPVAVAAARKSNEGIGDTGQTREARVLVVGNEGFASNAQIAVTGGNLNFLLNAAAWLTQSEELIAIRAAAGSDAPLILTDVQERAVTWITTVLTVQLVLLPGVVIYFVRRRNR